MYLLRREGLNIYQAYTQPPTSFVKREAEVIPDCLRYYRKRKNGGLGFCRLGLSLTSIGMRKRVRVPDNVDSGLRASRKWAAMQDPAVLREKNRLSKQRIRRLDWMHLTRRNAPRRAMTYTLHSDTPRPDPTPSTSANPCNKLNIIHEYPHPTAIDPGRMESSPTRHQTVGRCDKPSAHSPDHSLSESGIPEVICVDDLANASMSARTVFNPAYIRDPSFVTVDASDGATFPALGHDEAICRGIGGGVFELDGIPSVQEKADLTELVTDYAKFFDNLEVIQMKDSTRMCLDTVKERLQSGRKGELMDAAAVRALSRYELVTESTSRVAVITEFSSNEELAAKVRCEFSHGRYVYIPGGSMGSIRKDGKNLDMSYLQEFKTWSRQPAQCIVGNRGASDYEQRFSNPKAQRISTTIRDFLNAIDDPKCLNDGDNGFGVVKHSYSRSVLIHAGQRYHRSWGLLHHACVLTDVYHDAEGHSTAIVGQKGVKF
ncbi:hypothetical protein EDD85DRAFT_990671 [Armillaria nabsnona]|nr:hypothetical protein EDD85DRAFT_990671 [Armillaria nabsnona]